MPLSDPHPFHADSCRGAKGGWFAQPFIIRLASPVAAATRVNAQIIGKAADLGTIEPGKLADVIVVNGNPLFDIVALSHVEIVVKDGTVFKSADGAAGKPRTPGSEKQR